MTTKMTRYDITRLATTTPSIRGLRSHLEAIQTGPCSDTIDDALVGRVMERFERSRLSTGARVSVPYLLLDTHTSVTDQIMKEYTEDTQQYYKEQLQGFEKQREEDDEAKLRIDQLRDLHRNVFMRHVHVELGKLWEKRDS